MYSKKTLLAICLFIIVLLGFWFRFQGIIKGLSFWNDESHVALFSRGIIWHGKPINEIGQSTGIYQIALYYLTAAAFKLFGINEFGGRILSVIIGTITIICAYFVTKKMTGLKEAFIVAFLTAFSQIQLAWSTQLRPYIWLQLIVLFVVYFSWKYLKETKRILDFNIVIAFLLSFLATLFHGTGIVYFLIILSAILYKAFKSKKYIYILLPIPFFLLIIALLFFFQRNLLIGLFYLNFDITHYKVFLGKNYVWLFLGAMIGTFFLWKKDQKLTFILVATTTIIFAISIFKLNSYYVRYSFPGFIFLYILFASGMTYLLKLTSQKLKMKSFLSIPLICLIVLLVGFPLYQKKLLLVPQYYYSINADVRENPIVDYKSAFEKINQLAKGKKNLIVMDAWNDRVPYYMPHQKFIWLNRIGKGEIDPTYGEKTISSVSQFRSEKKNYSSGIVIVENWESHTSPELQEYIRKNLKHEFDIQNLPYNEDDKWSISIYSYD